MIYLLTSDVDMPNTVPFRAAVEATGLVPDVDADAFKDCGTQLNQWRIHTVPCLAKVHDGVAVDQLADLAGLTAADIEARFDAAVTAYEADRAGA
jgi:hypothetical protein